jgi:hypothetical protein
MYIKKPNSKQGFLKNKFRNSPLNLPPANECMRRVRRRTGNLSRRPLYTGDAARGAGNKRKQHRERTGLNPALSHHG